MIVQLLVTLVLGASAQAGQWTCTANQWLQGPAVRDGMFAGVVGTTCQVSAGSGGYHALRNHFIESTERTKLNAGPVSETFYGLPGVRYDATDTLGSGDNAVTVRALVHIATDEATRLLFATASTNVSGTGMAEYLRTLNSVLDVGPLKNGAYKVTLSLDTTVEKPWYAPGGVFQQKAADAIMGKFEEAKNKVLPEVANNL